MQAVLFDMDGVLVDSECTYLETKTQMLRDRGIDKDESYQYQFMGTTHEHMWQVMKAECQLPESVAYYIQEMNQRRHDMIARDGVKPIKGVVDFVKALHGAGLPLAVASSSPRAEIEHFMEELGLNDCFQVYVSGEEVAHSKPAPDIFIEAARQLGLSAGDCVVFEDTKNGSLAAHRSGAYTIGFENPDYPSQDLSAADEIISDFSKINLADFLKDFEQK
ncbi:haloacid dehalogenase [Aerococcus loyolae]|uniref:HAD family hydrolase n=1 Tax=Aerococcus urinae TaxID=1376 RepID=A0A2I1L6R4_9LACT|nr:MULTISPECIES: HAD family hydrolase [Aerococcus]MCY3067844.1 HAD family hydrolase [Aerococcus mictus]MCY3080657.1 HAD family hydrolase [Aerococcus mictus]MDK6727929.1 HAD family hydrolase [Aerococcus urinae]MDK7910210.1 HAD family hydrolase [Aerococcus urinae]MDK8610054.1 HAD family hydrolase [Aerococcus urinae]